jgi:hypothetical protein
MGACEEMGAPGQSSKQDVPSAPLWNGGSPSVIVDRVIVDRGIVDRGIVDRALRDIAAN